MNSNHRPLDILHLAVRLCCLFISQMVQVRLWPTSCLLQHVSGRSFAALHLRTLRKLSILWESLRKQDNRKWKEMSREVLS